MLDGPHPTTTNTVCIYMLQSFPFTSLAHVEQICFPQTRLEQSRILISTFSRLLGRMTIYNHDQAANSTASNLSPCMKTLHHNCSAEPGSLKSRSSMRTHVHAHSSIFWFFWRIFFFQLQSAGQRCSLLGAHEIQTWKDVLIQTTFWLYFF